MANRDQATGTHSVHRVKDSRPSSRSSKHQTSSIKKELDGKVDCVRCGYGRHKKGESCPAIGSTCHACEGHNHFSRVCVKSDNATVTDKKSKGKRINSMKCNSRVEDSEDTSCSDTESRDIRTVHA